MPWSSLASNQAVSRNNLQDAVNTGVFTLKNIIPATDECVTKDEANFYVNINTSNAGYSSKAANQLVYKADLTAPASGVVFTVTSGLYPVSGTSSTAIGNLTNYTANAVFIRGVFNSGGLNSGAVNNDRAYYQTYYIGYSGANITSYGQNIFTNFGTQAPNDGYAVVLAGQTLSFTLDKFDGLGGGSTFRLAYATASSAGPYTII